jgi:hypothetical protein
LENKRNQFCHGLKTRIVHERGKRVLGKRVDARGLASS